MPNGFTVTPTPTPQPTLGATAAVTPTPSPVLPSSPFTLALREAFRAPGAPLEDAGGTALQDLFAAIAQTIRESQDAQAASDAAGLALQRELGIRGLELQERTQAFTEQDVQTQRLLEAAGLATGPTGAIQLAFLARGQGAPQEDIAALFQNLPFVQSLLAGETLPSFGVPEQLGGEFRRVSPLGNVIEGQNLGVTIPAQTGVSRTQFENLTPTEQAFLGALGQSETGTPASEFLEGIMRTFIPENIRGGGGGGVSIGV